MCITTRSEPRNFPSGGGKAGVGETVNFPQANKMNQSKGVAAPCALHPGYEPVYTACHGKLNHSLALVFQGCNLSSCRESVACLRPLTVTAPSGPYLACRLGWRSVVLERWVWMYVSVSRITVRPQLETCARFLGLLVRVHHSKTEDNKLACGPVVT